MSSGTQHLPTGVLAYLMICVFSALRVMFQALVWGCCGSVGSPRTGQGGGTRSTKSQERRNRVLSDPKEVHGGGEGRGGEEEEKAEGNFLERRSYPGKRNQDTAFSFC